MTYPPLPEPTVIDGRRLYTAGDMREYGQACAESEMLEIDKSRMKNNASGQPSPEVERLFGTFGMKI